MLTWQAIKATVAILFRSRQPERSIAQKALDLERRQTDPYIAQKASDLSELLLGGKMP
ncbi:MAG: hypothetical protein VXW65_00395 [Pseudomonadota bacterium]|nr:hypothetical protein [Pseudomonadota bacterium]